MKTSLIRGKLSVLSYANPEQGGNFINSKDKGNIGEAIILGEFVKRNI